MTCVPAVSNSAASRRFNACLNVAHSSPDIADDVVNFTDILSVFAVVLT